MVVLLSTSIENHDQAESLAPSSIENHDQAESLAPFLSQLESSPESS